MRRCEKMWEDVRRCEKMWEDEEKMGGWEDVKMRRCEDEKMWRCEDVKMRRCEDERMWRWEDVKMRGCEDEKMWRWEDVKMRRCEDERMWRWEDVLQTPTIGRTLRSDALGKKVSYHHFWGCMPNLLVILFDLGLTLISLTWQWQQKHPQLIDDLIANYKHNLRE